MPLKALKNYLFLLLSGAAIILVGCDNADVSQESKQAQEAPVNKSANTASASTSITVDGKYKAALVPEGMTVQEKKARFKALLVPPTQKVYEELKAQYAEVADLIEQGKGADKIAQLKTKYKAETDEALLQALKPHPPSIVLAQAAMESAWATSRFFVEANNVFGVWSFNKNEPRIAAGEQRGDKTIWLKKYATIEESVRDNYKVLATSGAFSDFRALRMKTDNPYELVKKLDRYSEKGAEYGKELTSMISFNKLGEYDDVFHEKP